MKTLELSDFQVSAKLSPQCAELKLRLREEIGSVLKWTGRIRGPYCSQRQTLVANYPIRTGKESAEGAVTIPDFCHWSSAGPFTYQIELELKRGEEAVGVMRDSIAIAWVYVHQAKLFQAGKRWVPRMARLRIPRHDTEEGLSELRTFLQRVWACDLVLVVREGEDSDSLLLECQRWGVSVAIESETGNAAMIARWESFGCVLLVFDRGGTVQDATSLLMARDEKEDKSVDAVVWSISHDHAALEAKIVVRNAQHDWPEDARAACDRLQADAARLGDWAGYCG